jgi:hypothetical protein
LSNVASITASTLTKVAEISDGIKRFAKLERVLAALCLLTPALLIYFDNGTIRASISSYFNMKHNQAYYFPLTMIAMLFIVNGVIKNKKIYNTVLGVMMAGLILIDHDSSKFFHYLFAIGFFLGNAVVILVYSSRRERWFKAIMVGVMVCGALMHILLSWFTLFWAEWLSMGIISLHYILESLGIID